MKKLILTAALAALTLAAHGASGNPNIFFVPSISVRDTNYAKEAVVTNTLTATSLVASNATLSGTVTAGHVKSDVLSVFNVKSPPYNATGNGIADDTGAVTNAIKAAQSTGGTVFFPPGSYLITGRLRIPIANNWATGITFDVGNWTYESDLAYECMTNHTSSIFATDLAAGLWSSKIHIKQLRLQGAGADIVGIYSDNHSANFATLPSGGSILLLNAVDSLGKFDLRAHGTVEIDHLTLTDTADGTTPFVYSLNSTLKFHDNLVFGKTPATWTGIPANLNPISLPGQDGIILGGLTNLPFLKLGENDTNSGFAGWGTVIKDNVLDRLRRAFYLRATANNVQINNNMLWARSGNTSGIPAIDIYGSAGSTSSEWTSGGVISGNHIELYGYPAASGIRLTNANQWLIIGNGFEDMPTTTFGVHFTAAAHYNTMIGGHFVCATPSTQSVSNQTVAAYANTILIPTVRTTELATPLTFVGSSPVSFQFGSSTAPLLNFIAPGNGVGLYLYDYTTMGVAGNLIQTGASYFGGKTKTLTSGALTTIAYIPVANTNAIGGDVVWLVRATDGTDTQEQTGRTSFGAVAKATAVTGGLTTSTNAAQVSAGTLTVALAENVATNNVFAFRVTATTSLTTTNLWIKWRLETPSVFTVNSL